MKRLYEAMVFLIFCFLFSLVYAENVKTFHSDVILMIIPVGLIFLAITKSGKD